MKKYALVKWLSGKDKGKFTAGVPTAWLRDFSEDDFDPFDKDAESYLCEWRETKKPPPGGYELHDAQVIELSNSVKVLESKATTLELAMSPKSVPDQRTPQKAANSKGSSGKVVKSLSFSGGSKQKEEKKKKNSAKVGSPPVPVRCSPRKAAKNNDPIAVRMLSLSGAGGSKRKTRSLTQGDEVTPQKRKRNASSHSPSKIQKPKSIIPKPHSSDIMKKPLEVSVSGVEDGNGILPQMNKMLEEMKALIEQVAPLKAALDSANATLLQLQPQLQQQQPSSVSQPKPAARGFQVEEKGDYNLVKWKGKEVKITSTSYESAMQASTPSAMTASLLVGSFKLSVLLESTLRGGKTKVGPNKGRSTKKLDSNVIALIKELVISRFPNYPGPSFNVAISQKLASLKGKGKGTEEKPQHSTSNKNDSNGGDSANRDENGSDSEEDDDEEEEDVNGEEEEDVDGEEDEEEDVDDEEEEDVDGEERDNGGETSGNGGVGEQKGHDQSDNN